MIRLLFLIRSLERGGAERQLVQLVKGLDKSRFSATVATFYDGGAMRAELEGLEGVQLFSLRKKSRWDLIPFACRLARVARRVNPQIVHGYMGVANELALLVGRGLGARVVWGLRASNRDFSRYDRFCAEAFRLGAWLSRQADLIVVNSGAGKQHHIARGYRGDRMTVIPNGIDTDQFRRDREGGQRMRAAWGVAEDEVLIGMVGRLDPVKDHPTFLRAAAILAGERPGVRFVCVGDGPARYRDELQMLAEELRLEDRVVWPGAQSDMPGVYSALDVLVSCSSGEGFSNAIAEAMACEVWCVVTNVGDSAAIVGSAGGTIPVGCPEALKAALAQFLDLSESQRSALAREGRQRILSEYTVEVLVRRTEAALVGVLR
jgi:glycosyltransferase involved in cell wall biosynthesis